MKIVVLDDARSRRAQIGEGLSKGKHDITMCISSNDFITAASQQKMDLILVDLDAWNKGKSMYNYFGVGKKLEKIPIIFYNADEGFSALQDRSRNDKDKIIIRPSEVQTILDTVQQSM